MYIMMYIMTQSTIGYMLVCIPYIVIDQDRRRGSPSISDYVPELPVEGCDGELDMYRTIAQDMIGLVNVSVWGVYYYVNSVLIRSS